MHKQYAQSIIFNLLFWETVHWYTQSADGSWIRTHTAGKWDRNMRWLPAIFTSDSPLEHVKRSTVTVITTHRKCICLLLTNSFLIIASPLFVAELMGKKPAFVNCRLAVVIMWAGQVRDVPGSAATVRDAGTQLVNSCHFVVRPVIFASWFYGVFFATIVRNGLLFLGKEGI